MFVCLFFPHFHSCWCLCLPIFILFYFLHIGKRLCCFWSSPKSHVIWNFWNGLVARLLVGFTVLGVGRVDVTPAAFRLKVETVIGPDLKKNVPPPRTVILSTLQLIIWHALVATWYIMKLKPEVLVCLRSWRQDLSLGNLIVSLSVAFYGALFQFTPSFCRSRSHRSSRRHYSCSRSHSRQRRSRSRSYSSEYRRRSSQSHSPMSNRRRHVGDRVRQWVGSIHDVLCRVFVVLYCNLSIFLHL